MEKPLKRQRSVNFTPKETAILISLIKSKIHILENKKCDSATCDEKNKAWKAIQIEFNKATSENFRDVRHLKLKYKKLKIDVRKKTSVSVEGCESGDRIRKPLTPIERIFKEIISSVQGGKGASDPLEIAASNSDDTDSIEVVEAFLQPVKSEISFSDSYSENSNSITLDITAEPSPKQACLTEDYVVLSTPTENEHDYSGIQLTNSLENCAESTASLKFGKHCNLSTQIGKRPIYQLAKAKLENVMLQRQILEEELKEKKLRKQMLKEEMERKKELHELEKEQMLIKIDILKTELQNNCLEHL